MSSSRIVDLTDIIRKLEPMGLATRHITGYSGTFSIKDHGHLLLPHELRAFIDVLHEGTPHHDRECTDLHRWNFEMIN
jgi:hypothetical protein